MEQNHSQWLLKIYLLKHKIKLQLKNLKRDNKMEENVIIKFGIWEISEFGIVGKVNPGYDYNIEKSRLWETRDYNGYLVWDWLIHLCEKTWITLENIHELNSAFYFGQDFFKNFNTRSYQSFITAQTLFVQKQIMDIRIEMGDSVSDENGVVKPDIDRMRKYQKLMSSIRFLKELSK